MKVTGDADAFSLYNSAVEDCLYGHTHSIQVTAPVHVSARKVNMYSENRNSSAVDLIKAM